jgi:toxin FitB
VSYLLDTNVISETRKRERADAGVRAWISSVRGAELYTSVPVIGEIRQGIERLRPRDPKQAGAYENWLAELRRTFARRIIPTTEEIAGAWGRMNVPNPLPAAYALMAATAEVEGMTVVTRNVPDFERTGVEVLNPFE